jgi:hypothetical protein
MFRTEKKIREGSNKLSDYLLGLLFDHIHKHRKEGKAIPVTGRGGL